MADMEGCLPGGTRPNTPHHHMGLSLQATVQMRLCRGCAQGGVWWKRGGGRAGARQGRTAQNSGRMFVFAATLVPRRRDIRHGNVGERENLNPRNHRGLALSLPRLRLAPAARWPVGLRTARWIAATPFLKHAGNAHGNVGDLTSASSAILASPRQASEL